MASSSIDRVAAADLVAAVVAIDSVNPNLVPGAAGEEEIAGFVADWLRDAGLAVELVESIRGRPSVVGTVRGTGRGRSLMLNAHTDTVGTAGMVAAHSPRVRDGRLYGRGAYDMKGGLAACMLAAAATVGRDLRGDVLVTAVSDEEHSSLGTQAVLERFTADAAIVTEPTALRVCIAHKGFIWLRIEATGRAAHGSRPELGRDAIAHMGLVLAELRELDVRLRAGRHPVLGGGSIHASLIQGGQELSSYPRGCSLDVERRTIPGDTEDSVRNEIEWLLDRVRSIEPQAQLSADVTLVREPFEVDPAEAIVQTVVSSAHVVTGRVAELYGDAPWMDAALLAAAGIPTVVFGPAGGGAHALEEWVELDSVVACARALQDSAERLCR